LLCKLRAARHQRIHVQNRLTEIEERVQELGVARGESDSQKELRTVKLTLRETERPRLVPGADASSTPLNGRLFRYASLGAGFLCFVIGAWLIASLMSFVQRVANCTRHHPFVGLCEAFADAGANRWCHTHGAGV
jgi:hypothetical protein